MEIKRAKIEVQKQDDAMMFEAIFDDLVSKGNITKEVTISGVTFVLKPLSTSEVLAAESVSVASISAVPMDVVSRVRTVSTLAHAIISVNGKPIEAGEKEDALREQLHRDLLKLPPTVLDELSLKYRDLIEEQSKLYRDAVDNIENF